MTFLEPEAGIFYAVCWFVVAIRLISRRMHRGSWKRLQLDDYLILVAMATECVTIACMHVVVRNNSNLMEPGEDVSKFTQTEKDDRIYGSKLVLVIEQMQIATIWLVKTCLLIMYNRMTLVLPQHRIVIATAFYVGTTFLVMEILYFGVWCRPFSEYWALPPHSRQCSAATSHLITNAVFNISSDIIILSIPMPLLFKVRLPKKSKAILFSVFLIGAFTIVAAVLNKYYSFTNPYGTEWTKWYLRESYTAILCANLPLIYPLIQRVFRLRNWSSNSNTIDGEYHITSEQLPTVNSQGVIWPDNKPQPAHISCQDHIRRSASLEIMRAACIEQKNNPQFITSAIDLEEISVHTTPGLRSSDTSSLGTPLDWKPGEHSIPGADPYNAK